MLRLSYEEGFLEVRDNYLSKNQRLLKAAKALQRRFLKV